MFHNLHESTQSLHSLSIVKLSFRRLIFRVVARRLRWAALCAANPKYFDGSLLQVLGTSRNGHGGVQIHVQECLYRFYAVQRADGDWQGLDCGVRPLGVKALTRRGEALLMGRRSRRVAFYPGLWEFVPGGGLEPGVEPAVQVLRELSEEAGMTAVSPPIAVAKSAPFRSPRC